MNLNTFLLSVVGVDGSGKTTVLEELRRRDVLPGAIYVRTDEWRCDHLLRRSHRKQSDGSLNFVQGSFAQARPFATALDVLHTFEAKIKPHLGQVPYIVVERYVLSAMAYFGAMGYRSIMYDYFAELPKADLTIYLRADMNTLTARYKTRVFNPDEAPELMRRHSEALDALAQEADWPIVTVNNTLPFGTAFEQIENAIRTAIAEWHVSAVAIPSTGSISPK